MAEYTVRQAADMSGLSERHIWRLVAKRTLSAVRDEDGRMWIEGDGLERLVARRERAARRATPGATSGVGDRELRQRLEDLERRFVDLEGEVRRWRASVQAMRERSAPRAAGSSTEVTHTPITAPRANDLPEDLVGILELADAHRLAHTTVFTAAARGDFPVLTGYWLRGRGHLTRAVDAEGRRAFYALFRDNPRFEACEACPH